MGIQFLILLNQQFVMGQDGLTELPKVNLSSNFRKTMRIQTFDAFNFKARLNN